LSNYLPVKGKKKFLLGVIITLLLLSSLFLLAYSRLTKNDYERLLAFLEVPEIMSYTEEGKQNLIEAKNFTMKADFENSASKILLAKENFQKAQAKLNEIDLIYSRFIPFIPTNTANKILKAAINGVDILSYVNHILWTLITEYDFGQILVSLENILDLLDQLDNNLRALNLLVFPENIRNKIEEVVSVLDQIVVYREFLSEHMQTLYSVFGMDEAKTYMVALQNTAEARATGGYIGSIVLFTVQNGKLSNFEFLDTHLLDFEGGHFSPAPEYLNYIKRIALQESNYSPDIRLSGQRMKYFLEEQGGPTVETIIFIDDQILPFVLDLLGPVNIKGFAQEINKDNYFNLLQLNIETTNLLGKDRIKNPKEDYFKFIEAVRQKILEVKPTIDHLNKIKNFINKKNIQIFSSNKEIEKLFDELGFVGYFPEVQENQDFLAIIHSTFFNKSNRFMEDEIIHSTEISDDGELINKLTINRNHSYDEEKEEKILEDVWPVIAYQSDVFREDFLKVVGKSDNLDLLRVYVPKNSELLSVEGIARDDIYIEEELERTFFAFPLETNISEKREIVLEYKLPFVIGDIKEYNLFVFKQAGSLDSGISKIISYQDENIVKLKKQEKLINDLLFFIKDINNSIWNKNLQITIKKNKLQSKLKMKNAQGFMPMQLL